MADRGRREFLSVLPPQFFQPLIAPAAVAIIFISQRVLLIVVLMVSLGWIEFARGYDFGHDGLLEPSVERFLRSFCELLLLLAVVENAGAILRALVAELAAGVERIDVAPKHVEQLFVA